jgi:hypothetical protein
MISASFALTSIFHYAITTCTQFKESSSTTPTFIRRTSVAL